MSTPADRLEERQVVFRLQARTKIGAIKESLDAAASAFSVPDPLALLQAILNQESIHSCRFAEAGDAGPAAALVHARSDFCMTFLLGIGIAPNGVPWTPSGGDRTHLLAVLVAPHGDGKDYAWMRDRLQDIFRRADLRKALVGAASPAEVIHLLRRGMPCAETSPDPSPRSTGEPLRA
jgi:mannitol/fructose-specific phosphotransferase system IIA component (Ntr-type)